MKLYKNLQVFLTESSQDIVQISFSSIEEIIANNLPKSARSNRAWWSNRRTGVQAKSWLDAGYKVDAVDLMENQVVFRRIQVHRSNMTSAPLYWKAHEILSLREYLDLNQTQFASLLGVRQQTISEWENGLYEPKRSTCLVLDRIAKEHGFLV